jgi:hypothetical protein
MSGAALEVGSKPQTASPDHILEIGLAFRKSKALLSAVGLGLFTALADGPLGADALATRLGLPGRGSRDFFDALVALGLLERDCDGRYANTPDGAHYLDKRQPTYIGGMFEYINARLYPSWHQLTQALRTGMPQSGPLGTGGFAALHADAVASDVFLKGMTGGSLLPALALASTFPWHNYRTMIDIGTAQGCVPIEIARAHPHLTGGGFDLPSVEHAFTSYVRQSGMAGRLRFYPGDFLQDEFPHADVLIMGRILHDWDLHTKKLLLRKAHHALSYGGALIVYDSMIDDARRVNAHALLASLNMLIQTAQGFEYTSVECLGWMEEAGFPRARVQKLTAVHTAVIAEKN